MTVTTNDLDDIDPSAMIERLADLAESFLPTDEAEMVEALDALPVGTVVLDADGDVGEKQQGWSRPIWRFVGQEESDTPLLPVRVLYAPPVTPEAQEPTT
ncbi:hypothetical protein [Subtercola vilae]|uniref:hypothetical protein n=1 Tax=Subtercola vilae TaxID=2056433 RepID=UPI0010A9C519|nr:hypothetical protein [Subtercola vilae]